MENSFKTLPPPLDTGIPDKHCFIFIKEVDTTNGVLYLEGGVINDFWYFRKRDEGDTFFYFELFTLNIYIIIKQYSDYMCFSSILAANYESYLIYVKKTYASLLSFGPHKNLLNSNPVSKFVSTAAE